MFFTSTQVQVRPINNKDNHEQPIPYEKTLDAKFVKMEYAWFTKTKCK
jgi:hypothetical protein